MTYHWSIHQLTEYLVAVSWQTDPKLAAQTAIERALESVEAELGAIVVAGHMVKATGFGGQPVPPQFDSAVDGDLIDIPGLGEVYLGRWPLATSDGRGTKDGILLVGRAGEPFAAEERQMLQGMALILGLLLHNLETLASERQRHQLVENLLQIQRAISARLPLNDVLDAVTSGASVLLGNCPVALLLLDRMSKHLAPVSGHNLTAPDEMMIAVARRAMDPGPVPAPRSPKPDGILVERVVVGGEVVGCLAARTASGPISGHDPAELLTAFAQQVNLALTDAQTLDAVREAHRDPVTSLSNRALFLERLSEECATASIDRGPLTVLFIDLDRFKAVNDTLGHRAGDELLAQVAHRLLTCISDVDTAARLGGDEFAVLLRADRSVGEIVAGRIIAALTRTFTIAGRPVMIGASVGVASMRENGQSAAALLSDADVAMYRAKRGGRGRWQAFEPQMHEEVADQLSLRTDLGGAVANGELWLAYQPLIDIASRQVHGVEALLRWDHPLRGQVPPSLFIPIAEETDTICILGSWVIDRAFAQLATWRAQVPALHLAINISARQITDPQLPSVIATALDRESLPGHSITLEITESVLMTDPHQARTALEALKRLGVRVAIDDFGTGYSSLAYLRQLPVDQVKIDRSFVSGLMPGAVDDIALVGSILDLCRSMRLETVAEGIETAEQLALLTELGCNLGQGYFLARPQPASANPHLLGMPPAPPSNTPPNRPARLSRVSPGHRAGL
ncbi:MAG TPA: EAL domain-containing protein [Kineosporiaceae bacterium]